jgi:hypothetical protein
VRGGDERKEALYELHQTGLHQTDIGKIALAAVPLARLCSAINSKFYGVQIGAITYGAGS